MAIALLAGTLLALAGFLLTSVQGFALTAHLAAAQSNRASTRGPGWQRGQSRFSTEPQRVIEARASAVSLGNQGRTDLSLGQRVFHQKFGYGAIAAIEGNKLEIEFEQAGRKRVMDTFVTLG